MLFQNRENNRGGGQLFARRRKAAIQSGEGKVTVISEFSLTKVAGWLINDSFIHSFKVYFRLLVAFFAGQ